MNFLAHLYLADITNDSLLGQLLGDFVKGRAIYDYHPRIQAAIHFHRRIDSYCDAHPITRTSRNRIGPVRRRFAGILVDVCYDHFLARDWHCFNSEPLTDFAQRVYTCLAQNRIPLPDRFGGVLSRMIAHDWLGGYYHLDKVALALDRIADRLSCGQRFKGGIADIMDNYRELQSDFHAFFPEVVRFSKAFRNQSTTVPAVP